MSTRILIFLGLAAGACAAPTFSLRTDRYFGDPNDRSFDTGVLPYNASTSQGFGANYNLGGEYIGSTFMQGPNALFSAATSVQLPFSVVTENVAGYLARDRVTLRDSVLVTGGAGTAYLSPIVRVTGGFADNSPELYASIDACFGTGNCVALSSPAGVSTGGIQNFDLVWSPSPQVFPSVFEFTFGAPVTTFMFLGTRVAAFGGQGVATTPGASLSGNFDFQLLGYRVLDASGNEIPGVSIESGFLPAPEPSTWFIAAAGLALLSRLRGS